MPSYKVNGVALPTPDEDVSYTYSDMNSKSWRDGAGVLHSAYLRRNVLKVELKWTELTQTEFNTIKNATRSGSSFGFKFEDITDGSITAYSGADFTFSKHRVDSSGNVIYKDVSLSFIQI